MSVDRRIRELERLAAAGDPDAAERFRREADRAACAWLSLPRLVRDVYESEESAKR